MTPALCHCDGCSGGARQADAQPWCQQQPQHIHPHHQSQPDGWACLCRALQVQVGPIPGGHVCVLLAQSWTESLDLLPCVFKYLGPACCTANACVLSSTGFACGSQATCTSIWTCSCLVLVPVGARLGKAVWYSVSPDTAHQGGCHTCLIPRRYTTHALSAPSVQNPPMHVHGRVCR